MKKITLLLFSFLLVLAVQAQNSRQVIGIKEAKESYLYNKPVDQQNLATPFLKSAPVITKHKCSEGCTDHHIQKDGSVPFICATDEADQIMRRRFPQWRTTLDFEQFIYNKSQQVRKKLSLKSGRGGESKALYKIPVIVHVLYFDGQAIGQDHNITKEQVYSQFEVLNEDYRKKRNSRGYNVEEAGADALIEFVPALYDPEGNLLPEPGIHRIKAEDITDGEYTISSSNRYMEMNWSEWVKKQTHWNHNCYFNLWSLGLTGGVLGYAAFPDTDLPGIGGLVEATPAEYDGVVVDYRRFGSYEKGPFQGTAQDSKGRAASHEVGHFLGLRHTWGDGTSDSFGQYPNGCEYDDYVEDTPNSKEPMYINKPLYLCGEREMIENFMDYASDYVKNVFTNQQVERMHTVMEYSPRRKELAYSTVAVENGNKTPVVEIQVSSKNLKVYELFSLDAYVYRFPGKYEWTFEGGIPATSTERNPGVYFTTPGTKKISLTVSNTFSSVIQNIYVNVAAFESCEPLFNATLKTLNPLVFNEMFGYYMTGHGDVFGVKQIASKFEMVNDDKIKALTQVEMAFKRFVIQTGYNPDKTFDLYIMDEDSEGKPGDVLATQKIRVGDAYKAFQANELFTVYLDNPIIPSTGNYFIVIDLDYNPLNRSYVRGYKFELKAGISPVNYSWSYGVTRETTSSPPEWQEYDWIPYTASEAVDNGWEASILMYLLPKFSPDGDAVRKPEFTIPASTSPGIEIEAELNAKPEGITKVQWKVQKGDKDTVITDENNIKIKWEEAGEYLVSLTYFGEPCLQKTTTKQIVVKGIRFEIEAYREEWGDKVMVTKSYCSTNPITLGIVEKFSSGSGAVYRWSGGDIPTGTVGETVEVMPEKTTTYTATTTDENGKDISETITIEYIPAEPKAVFKILSPHVIVSEDTIALYLGTDPIRILNESENGEYYNLTTTRIRDNKSLGDEYMENTGKYELDKIFSFEGSGLYLFRMNAVHPGCGWETESTDYTELYVKVYSEAQFGEVDFSANGKPLSIATSLKYPEFVGSYVAYVNPNEEVILKAESDEITQILWTNSYNYDTYTTKEVNLGNVRDRAYFIVNVVRERVINGQTLTHSEDLTVVLLFNEDISSDAVADFYPQFDSVCVGQTVKFVNTSRNVVNFRWDFSGGEDADDERLTDLSLLWAPNRVFNTAGEYTAKLTITDIEGNELSKEKKIYVGSVDEPVIEAKPANSYCKISNDTLYVYDYSVDRTDTRLVVTGNGITNKISYYFYTYVSWMDSWEWQEQTEQNGRFRPFLVPSQDWNIDDKLKIIAEDCDGNNIEKIYQITYVSELRYPDYQLKINGDVFQFSQYTDLASNQVAPSEKLTLALLPESDELKDQTEVFWYKKNNDGSLTEISKSFTIEDYPQENTIFVIFFRNKIGQGYQYNIPIEVGIGRENLMLMNHDLTLDEGNVVEIPWNYSNEIIVLVDGVIKPVWYKVGETTILSGQNAVVLAPESGLYEVVAYIGTRKISATVEIKVGERPEEPGEPEEPADNAVIALYPVPARDILNIDSPYEGKAYIVDNLGRLIKQINLQKGPSTLSVSDLPSGVYKLVLQQANKGKIIHRSFIVIR